MAWSSPRTWTTGEVVTAAHMNQEIRDNLNALFPDGVTGVSWSPTLEATTTDPGTSAVAGVEYTDGAVQKCWARWVLSSGGTGTYFVTLPSTAVGLTAASGAGEGQAVGSFQILDISPAHMLGGTVLLRSTTRAHFMSDSDAHGTPSGVINHNTPRTWASGDILSFYAQYPIA